MLLSYVVFAVYAVFRLFLCYVRIVCMAVLLPTLAISGVEGSLFGVRNESAGKTSILVVKQLTLRRTY